MWSPRYPGGRCGILRLCPVVGTGPAPGVSMKPWIVASVGVVALLGGCGDKDEGDGGAGEPPPSDEAPVATVSSADATACLTEGGLEALPSTVEKPEALIEKTREVETIEIAGEGDLVGLGHATWYEDVDAAEEGHADAELISTDEVHLGQVGTVSWRFAGSDEAAAVIEGCLS